MTGRQFVRYLVVIAAMFASLVAPAAAPAATTYYVATTGNDANPGTESQPWRTVQKAADTLVAGDTVYVRGGTYSERVIPRNSGAEGAQIVYAAFAGETPTLDGSGIALPEDLAGLFEVSAKSHITVKGLRVTHAGPGRNSNGILVIGSSYVTLEDNVTYDTQSSGIGVWQSNHVTVAGNEVELACNDGEQECITVAGTDVFEIRDNHVHHSGPGTNGGEGIDAKDGSSNGTIHGNRVHHIERLGIYVDSWDKHTHDIEVFNNVVHDTNADGFTLASEMGGLLENVKVYNNVAYNNQYVGIYVSKCCTSSRPISNIQIVNNTLVNNGRGSWGGGIYNENPQATGVVIRNNLVSQNLSFQIGVDPSVPTSSYSADHNLIDGFRGDPEEIRGTDYVEGDPRFADAAGDDFHIQNDSPAVGMGSSVGAPTTDFDGYLRGTPPDIGAYEHRGGGTQCSLSCIASAPTSAQVNESVDFSSTATPSSACAGSVSYDWDFGDNSPHASTAQAQHAYASAGSFTWKLKASVDSVSCPKSGSIQVGPSITPPTISSVWAVGSPFRIKISGGNFQEGVQLFIGTDVTAWGADARKKEWLIVLKGGSSLRARFPQGQAVSIRVFNPDGGEATTTYTRP